MRSGKFRNRDWSDPKWQDHLKNYEQNSHRNKLIFGVFLALIGAAWILKLVFNIPFNLWENWPVLIIIIGLLIGFKNNFNNPAWWILCIIGGAKLVEQHLPGYDDYILPAILVIVGLFIAFKPRRKPCAPSFKFNKNISAESNLDIDVTFGGRKEVVTSKEFVSGNISVTFGGCEINFMQAELAGDTAILNMRVSFGGVELTVPSHWHVQNEINPAFGNVEDERKMQTGLNIENRKTLIIRGSCSFGNVEILSH